MPSRTDSYLLTFCDDYYSILLIMRFSIIALAALLSATHALPNLTPDTESLIPREEVLADQTPSTAGKDHEKHDNHDKHKHKYGDHKNHDKPKHHGKSKHHDKDHDKEGHKAVNSRSAAPEDAHEPKKDEEKKDRHHHHDHHGVKKHGENSDTKKDHEDGKKKTHYLAARTAEPADAHKPKDKSDGKKHRHHHSDKDHGKNGEKDDAKKGNWGKADNKDRQSGQ